MRLKPYLLPAASLLGTVAARDHSSNPLTWVRRASSALQTGITEQAWLWGWAWGPDSTVSIVDRSPPVSFLSRPAGFGAELTDPLLGYVIPLNAFTIPCPSSDPNTSRTETAVLNKSANMGCSPLCVVGDNVPGDDPWIALVQRGECQFVDKAREAQRLGAKGVVVGGDDPELHGNPDVLVNMYSPGDASDISIAATFIRFSDYMQLYSLILSSNTSHSGLKTLSLLISSEYSSWQWYSPIVTFITILFIPSSLTFLTLIVHRIRAARAAQRDRAPADVVQGLPWRVWTGTGWEKHDGAPVGAGHVDVERGECSLHPHADEDVDPAWFASQTECIICLENFAKGDRVRVLPCKHIFHLDEIDEWLTQRKKLCPVCKADVTVHRPPHHSAAIPVPEDGLGAASVVDPSATATERTPLLRRDSASTS